MHFPLMVILEARDESLLIDRLAPYYENSDGEETDYNPLYKWDFWGYGGRWTSILSGETLCRLKDFPRIRNEDSEDVLKEKFPLLHDKWGNFKSGPEGTDRNGFLLFLKTRYCYALLLPSGEWIEPGRYAWWLGTDAEKEEDVDWVEKYNRILDSFPGDYWVQLIDCHI